MDNPQGRVQSLRNDESGTLAVVSIDVAAVCPRCAAGKGCGAGIAGSAGHPRQVEALVPPGLDIREGDLVEVTLAPNRLLRAALIVYGLPLAGAVAAATLAYALALGDVAAAVAALAGVLAGLQIGRWRLGRDSCLSRFVPTIHRRQRDDTRAAI
ncbi:MAG: SoxR reducing system RseC family protein [Gammaproteobacteria bacterium]|nr:SoxR reducing system RseC family protein [Gammaproteobacteria bacterium]